MISSVMRWLLLLAGVWLLQGCSLFNVSSASYYRDGEGRFNSDVFESIEPHATTNAWLKQHFGKPFWVDKAEHDVAIHTWQFARERHKRKDVLLVLRYRSVREDVEYLHVVTQNDVVIKHWLDRYASVDVDRVIYALGLEVPQKAKPTEAMPNNAISESPTLQHSHIQQSSPSSPMPQSSAPAAVALPVAHEERPAIATGEHGGEKLQTELNASELTLPQLPEPVQAPSMVNEAKAMSTDETPNADINTTANSAKSRSDTVPDAPMVSVEANAESQTKADVSNNLYGI